MPTATLIGRDNISFAGPANHYQLDPPLNGLHFVTVFIEPGYASVAHEWPLSQGEWTGRRC